jgi:pimeloyl-ACP methyl ester carboxylesterase
LCYFSINHAIANSFPQSYLDKESVIGLNFEHKPDPNWRFSYFREQVFNANILVLEAGNKDAPPILLVHGLGERAMQDWFTTIPVLAKTHHVIALDLPGFGKSQSPKGRFSPLNYAQVLDDVVMHYSKGALSVIGHSMGGAVSLYFAGQYPEKVEKLILVDAAGILQKVAFIKPITHVPKSHSLLPSFVSTKLAQFNDFTTGLIEEGVIDSYLTQLLQRSDGAWQLVMGDTPNMNAALSLVEEDFSEIVANLKTPTHLIWGAEDAIAPLRTAKVLNYQLPYSELNVLENVGHVPMSEQREGFLTQLSHALNHAPKASVSEVLGKQQKITFHCKGESNKEFSGHFTHMIIDDCTNVLLKDVVAESVRIKDSLVRMENVTLAGADLALNIKRSVVELTNVDIDAIRAIKLKESRFDGAGVNINASKQSMEVKGSSNIIFSLSTINSPIYQGLAHTAIEMNEGIVDEHFKKTHDH